MTEPQLTENAQKVLEARYLRRDEDGHVAETPDELFRRVAGAIAAAEEEFGDGEARRHWEERFHDRLARLEFLPNSPTLMNAGTPMRQLSACFVLPVEDDMAGIFESLKQMALIQQSGGGTGFSFSKLRPEGDLVGSTGGRASGPVGFMLIFAAATENIRQGGKRRGANMAVLRADHPDVRRFIHAKRTEESLRNFNLSVAAPDEFLAAARDGRPWTLKNPRTGEPGERLSASDLFHEIVEAAWETGDPGLLFLGAVNRANPTPRLGAIEATNPCGEVPLLPYEACNLGSINLSRMVRGEGDSAAIDWEELGDVARLGVRFLDNVIQVSRWPSPQINSMVGANRKIGLGLMGFAEMLIQLGVPYGSDGAKTLAGEIMQFVAEQARAASRDLAAERGTFPSWKQSIYAERDLPLRNATQTSVAPTGTISIIAGTSASIEPLFALVYHRSVALEGASLPEVNPLFLEHARRQGFYSDEVVEQLNAGRPLGEIEGVPRGARELFRTALEIEPEDHLRIQAAFQAHVDNAVSKTINLPESATADDVGAAYETAWNLGLKGVTIFRYGSKSRQVLNVGAEESPQEHEHYARCDPGECRV